MKRFTVFALLLIGTLGICQRQEQVSAQDMGENNVAVSENMQEDTAEEKVLIAYFTLGKNADYPKNVDATTSASLVAEDAELYGTTEYVGKMIQDLVGGDMHLMETREPYPAEFNSVVDQNHAEADAGTLPELKNSELDISQYDTVFVGYPIWASTAPQAVFSFLEEYDLSGKTVIPFCTHDGYGAGSSYDDIAAVLPNTEVLDGLAIEAGDVPEAEDTMKQWLREIGLESSGDSEMEQLNETSIRITIGDETVEGVIYDTALANEIRERFPLTVSMGGFGGREYYGGIDFTPENVGEGQLSFEDGDITYCSQNNTMAIFYAQTDHPDLTMEVIPIGRVTSDLSVFDELPGNVDITFELAE